MIMVKNSSKKVSLFLLLCFLLLPQRQIFAQQVVTTKKVIIGVKEAPPFVKKSNNNKFGYEGLSIESWEMVNANLNWEYEYKAYSTLDSLLKAIQKKEVDFSINPITVTETRAKEFTFTQPYFISNTIIAKKNESAVWNVFMNLWSWKFISAVGVLVSVIFIFGLLIWLVERRENKEQFGVGKWKGLEQGFWWSAVTMTTVGYGDKAPRTTLGRFIGIAWMFISVITISSLTAGIASSLTVQNLNNEITTITDLNKFKVETIANSSSADLLKNYNIAYTPVNNVKEGLFNLKNNTTQILVYDEPLVYYEIEQQNLKDKIQILPHILRKDYFSYCFPKDSKIEEQINPYLISTLKSVNWMSVIKKYQYQ